MARWAPASVAINQGPYKEDNKGWDVFARERNPTKALQVAVVLPTRKELRDRRRAAKTFSHDLKVESGVKPAHNIGTTYKYEALSDEQLREGFDMHFKKLKKRDTTPQDTSALLDPSIGSPSGAGPSAQLARHMEGPQGKSHEIDVASDPNRPLTLATSHFNNALSDYVQDQSGIQPPIKAEPFDEHLFVREVYEEITDEQIRDALAPMKNSGAKIKKDLTFSDQILYRRIQKIGPEIYPVEDSVNKYFLFSRYYFSNRYGGSFVATFPTMSKKKLEEHGIDDWAFPSLEYNPHAPQVPGAPGLFYTPNGHANDSWVSRVFVRLDGGKWLYVGMYIFAPSNSHTAEEFIGQPARIRQTWAREIKVHRTWGSDILARVYFRRQNNGREPTDDELGDVLLNKAAINSVSEEEIIEAYSTEKEVLGVFSMKCIGYDAEWITELVEDYPKWQEERKAQLAAKAAKKAAKKSSGKGAGTEGSKAKAGARQAKATAKTGLKRKVDDLESESNSEEERPMADVEDGNDNDIGVAEPVYVPRGTRSRPDAKRAARAIEVIELD